MSTYGATHSQKRSRRTTSIEVRVLTDGSVCERVHIEWRSSLLHVCDDLASHLATRLHTACHAALKQDEEALDKSCTLPHAVVPADVADNLPDCPRRILQVSRVWPML